MNDGITGHGLGVIVNLVMDLDGLEIEGKDTTFQELSSSKDNLVGWRRSGSGDAATQLDNPTSKDINVLSRILD